MDIYKKRGYGPYVEEIFRICEYMISQNCFEAPDLTIKNLFFRYTLTQKTQKLKLLDLTDVVMSIQVATMMGGDTELLEKLLEKLHG